MDVKQKLLFLFSFVLILDPSGLLLGVKDILFFFLLIFLFYTDTKYRKEAILLLIAVYAMITVTFLLGKAQGFESNYGFTMFIYKTFALLFLLGWIDRLKFLETIYFPAILVALISIVIYYIATEYNETNFYVKLYDFSNLPHRTFTISWRSFIGYDVLGVYYRSAPILLLPLSIYFSKILNRSERSVKIILAFLLLFVTTLLSGARALMLSGCGVVIFTIVNKMMNIYFWRRSVLVFIIMGTGMLLYAMILFLSEGTEASNVVKFGHLNSYVELFKSHPLILLFGQGAGSLFFSLGNGEYVSQTEWSYIEILRMFGILGLVIILILYIYPAYKIWRQRRCITFAIPFLIGYIFYLLNAGTNPLLLGSNGLLMLLTAYSLAYNPIYGIADK